MTQPEQPHTDQTQPEQAQPEQSQQIQPQQAQWTIPPPAAATPPAGNFGVGLVAAFAAAIVGAIVWAIITVTSGYKIGFVAVGIGFLVGFAIERFGGGDRRLPVAGALIALLGCVLGDLLADAHIIAKDLGVTIFDVLLHPQQYVLWHVYTHTFRAFDAVFFAIAAYEGFKFGQRGVQRAQAAAAAHHPAAPAAPTGQPAGPPAPAESPESVPDDPPTGH